MTYKVLFTSRAKKELKKLDKATALLITGWIRRNLEGCSDPRVHGEALTANLNGLWRYRIGKYRIISEIQDNNITIVILNLGHRREVYKR